MQLIEPLQAIRSSYIETALQEGIPSWMTEDGVHTLEGGYLLDGERPADMYWRVAKASASRLERPQMAEKFFSLFWEGWLGLASPVAANMGAERGLPISCFGIQVGDSMNEIFSSVKEMAHMSANGGGVGVYMGPIRGAGAPIKGGGVSHGVIPWAKVFDSTTISVSQGNTRRGATAIYLPIDHPDIDQFLRMRRPQGDEDRRCMNIHHAVVITDDFMNRVEKGDVEARSLFGEVLRTRIETGEPYLCFIDNANRQRGEAYAKANLKISTSQICTEIFLYTDLLHSFICCLSSLNLTKFFKWKQTTAVQDAIWFLDGVLQEFIDKAKLKDGFERALRSAIKGRAIGLGVLGYHTLLQRMGIPFESLTARRLNKQIFQHIHSEANIATRMLAQDYGEPEWCKGTGRRNTHLIALAPTVSNSVICGNVSPSIEPYAGATFNKRSAKGTLLYYNPVFEELLEEKGQNNRKVWDSITEKQGSVQHLDFLSEQEKEVFLTAREINQMEIVRQAADRQEYIDQGQSINTFFPADVDPTYYAKVHMMAWRKGLKSLYYCRSKGVLTADLPSRSAATIERVASGDYDGCNVCEG